MKISIITPCYNSEKFLTETFNSVTSQSYKNWEWIIVDDCSTDKSLELLKSFASRRSEIKVFQNHTNSGASVSRNKGLDEASGEFIAFLDADDLWCETKLEKQIEYMIKNKAAFTFHNYDMMNEDGLFIKSMKSPNKINQNLLEMFNPIFTSSVMMKKDLIANTRFKPLLRRRQDYIFWHEIIKKSQFAYNVGEPLGRYRTGNKASLSGNKLQNIPIQWKIYRTEFKLNPFSATKSLVGYAFHGITKYFL